MALFDCIVLTCEHGGNDIPAAYRRYFVDAAAVLQTHRGFDIGALGYARKLAKALDAPLHFATVSRLLVDLNRSPGHPRLHSSFLRSMAPGEREQILHRYYLPYRKAAQRQIRALIKRGHRVLHLSIHSFTPQLNGRVRRADIGILYDYRLHQETKVATSLRVKIRAALPHVKVHLNHPYRGTSDGFNNALRRAFGARKYFGIELEINQKFPEQGGSAWRDLQTGLTRAIQNLANDGAGAR